MKAVPKMNALRGQQRVRHHVMVPGTYSLLFLLISITSSALAARPTVAIVSEKAFHLEVLAGFMDILGELSSSTVVYLHPLNFPGRSLDFGFLEFVNDFGGHIRGLPSLAVPEYDVLVFISPEYRVHYVREFIQRTKPKVVLFMVHNGDAEGVPELMTLHNNSHLLTLAPHVANFVGARLNQTVQWMLPLKALSAQRSCEANALSSCLSGFAIQGNMDSRRRNYTEIWQQLDEAINSSSLYKDDKRLHINVVGSGNPAKLLVPPWLEGRVQPHVNLKFLEFYELISSNLALIPTLATDAYYDRKFSSTLITSLVTGVPVIADDKFLSAYTFLSNKHIVLQQSNQGTVDIAKQVLRLTNSELLEVRAAINSLREELNNRAKLLLMQLLQTAT